MHWGKSYRRASSRYLERSEIPFDRLTVIPNITYRSSPFLCSSTTSSLPLRRSEKQYLERRYKCLCNRTSRSKESTGGTAGCCSIHISFIHNRRIDLRHSPDLGLGIYWRPNSKLLPLQLSGDSTHIQAFPSHLNTLTATHSIIHSHLVLKSNSSRYKRHVNQIC
jgi:hypothetical protein